MKTGLPEFGNPPLVDTTLMVQFERIERLRSAHLGLFSLLLREGGYELPELDEEKPREVLRETLGTRRRARPFRLQLAEEAPAPRTSFFNPETGRGLTIQQDMIEYTWWRNTPQDEYPRFASIFAEFWPIYEMFRQFIVDHDLGMAKPVQAEVSYSNALEQGVDWPSDGRPDAAVRVYSPAAMPDLPPLDDGHFSQRHKVETDDGSQVGRLYITLDTGMPSPYELDDQGTDWAVLSLTVRVLIDDDSPNKSDVKGLLDLGHRCIVRAFASVTTHEAQARWRRTV